MSKDEIKRAMKLLSECRIEGALKILEQLECETVPLTASDDYKIPEDRSFIDFFDFMGRLNELRDELLEERRNLVDE